MKIAIFSILLTYMSFGLVNAEDGYRLWLRYDRITDEKVLSAYQQQIKGWIVDGNAATENIIKNELSLAFSGLFGNSLPQLSSPLDGTLIVAKYQSALLPEGEWRKKINALTDEGFILFTGTSKGKKVIVVTAKTDVGLLYGTFQFIRLLQTHHSIADLSVTSSPKIKHRLLNHWDNLDRTVERGYAGFSLWDWHKLPDYLDQRYYDYARANASIGINGTVLTNVNANAVVLTEQYLKKVQALATLFRPYGIKVYLTARFSAPMEIGGLKTADPLDPEVKRWWKNKIYEIYRYVPDFGGFVVKANSEGQPGPQNYKRNHADGANMLAEALQPHGGIVMWRAFVYNTQVAEDRVKQAYQEFQPLDGKFLPNVLVQVKNGPLDFQPREPFHPLFGAMPKTPLMIEFQITQEYLGFATHLVYLAPLFKETLASDTYAKGEGSLVSKVIDGTLENKTLTGIAGVTNIGNDRNWTGHPFAQANWYAFGRLAWNHELTSEAIAEEWIRQTLSNVPAVVNTIKGMMMASREITVLYMTPLGLHHIMGWDHHYGPGPWIKDKPRAEWTSVYYHQADSLGIGFDRTNKGSNALEQYHPIVQSKYSVAESCPEDLLLWFHHVGWDRKLKSGNTLWQELCFQYYRGADSVRWMQKEWNSLSGEIDSTRHHQVKELLAIQYKEAVWWRNACTLYFESVSKRKIPITLPKSDETLEHYMALEFPFAPGIKPKW
jgi:alpha-glucuronidase